MKKLNFVHLGISGFPYGLAAIQKLKLICKSLNFVGVDVCVINRFGVHESKDLEIEGVYDRINYTYASGTSHRPKNFFIRKFFKLYGLINEIRILISLKNKLDAAIVSTRNFPNLFLYRILSKLLDIPLVLTYTESAKALNKKRSIFKKINAHLFDNFSLRLIDGAMPISDYLINSIENKSPNLPILKVPVLCDFEKFNNIVKNNKDKYFLFCSAIGYREVIDFIIESFEKLDYDDVFLYLIVNGDEKKLKELYQRITNSNKSDLIKTFSNLDYEDLMKLYINATGLLIPLRPTLQDKARFPHKIAEYCASGNPIITNNWGEINNYFINDENAIIAENYDVNEFSEKMDWVINNIGKASQIGLYGKKVGLENFDYKKYGEKIKSFILSLK